MILVESALIDSLESFVIYCIIRVRCDLYFNNLTRESEMLKIQSTSSLKFFTPPY